MKIKHIMLIFLLEGCINACKHKSSTDNITSSLPANIHNTLADLRFLKKKVDFGSVPADTVLNAKYDFVNISKDTLVIDFVAPDCSCTSYTLSKKRIPPEDSACITLQLSTKNKSGDVVLYSTVSANTPTKFYSLKIAANVR